MTCREVLSCAFENSSHVTQAFRFSIATSTFLQRPGSLPFEATVRPGAKDPFFRLCFVTEEVRFKLIMSARPPMSICHFLQARYLLPLVKYSVLAPKHHSSNTLPWDLQGRDDLSYSCHFSMIGGLDEEVLGPSLRSLSSSIDDLISRIRRVTGSSVLARVLDRCSKRGFSRFPLICF